MDIFDKIKEIAEEYEEKLLDLFIDQELRRCYPGIYPYSRFCLTEEIKSE